jgi:hypothetical protein
MTAVVLITTSRSNFGIACRGSKRRVGERMLMTQSITLASTLGLEREKNDMPRRLGYFLRNEVAMGTARSTTS